METLTQKQKDNRAYYARHADQIRAKKREIYNKSRVDKPPESPPVLRQKPSQSQKLQYRNPEKLVRKRVPPEDRAKCEARRRIEDWQLARELEIESF